MATANLIFIHAYLSFDEEDCEWDNDDHLVDDDKQSSPRETHRVKQDASHCGTNESACQKNDVFFNNINMDVLFPLQIE